MKKLLVLTAFALSIVSCSNPSDSVLAYGMVPVTPVVQTVQEEPINKTEVVDFKEDLTGAGFTECPVKEEGNWNWVYVPVNVWSQSLENKTYLKPVLKIKSDDRGVVFLYNDTRVDYVYKCVVYGKKDIEPYHTSTFTSVPFYYKDSNNKITGYSLYYYCSPSKSKFYVSQGGNLDISKKYLIW